MWAQSRLFLCSFFICALLGIFSGVGSVESAAPVSGPNVVFLTITVVAVDANSVRSTITAIDGGGFSLPSSILLYDGGSGVVSSTSGTVLSGGWTPSLLISTRFFAGYRALNFSPSNLPYWFILDSQVHTVGATFYVNLVLVRSSSLCPLCGGDLTVGNHVSGVCDVVPCVHCGGNSAVGDHGPCPVPSCGLPLCVGQHGVGVCDTCAHCGTDIRVGDHGPCSICGEPLCVGQHGTGKCWSFRCGHCGQPFNIYENDPNYPHNLGTAHGGCAHVCLLCVWCGGSVCEGQHGDGVCNLPICPLCNGDSSVGRHGTDHGECSHHHSFCDWCGGCIYDGKEHSPGVCDKPKCPACGGDLEEGIHDVDVFCGRRVCVGEHGPCMICRKTLCNGLEHGDGVCNRCDKCGGSKATGFHGTCEFCGGAECDGKEHGEGICDEECHLCGGDKKKGKHGTGQCIPKAPTNNPNGVGGRPGSWNWNAGTKSWEWTNSPPPPNPTGSNGSSVPGTYAWNSKTQSWEFTPTSSSGGGGGGPVDLTNPETKPTTPGSNKPGEWKFLINSEGTGEGVWTWTETPQTQITNPNHQPTDTGGPGPGEWGWTTGDNVGGGWSWVPPGTGNPPPTGGSGGGGEGEGNSDSKCPCPGCGKFEKDCTLGNCGAGCQGLCNGCGYMSCLCDCKHHTRNKCSELGCVNPYDQAAYPDLYSAWKCKGDVCCKKEEPCKCCGKSPVECGRIGCVATCDGRGCSECPKPCTCCGKKPAECGAIGCCAWCTGNGCKQCPQKQKCTCCGRTPAECAVARCVVGCPGNGCVGCPKPDKPGGGGSGDPDDIPSPVDRPPPPVPTPPPAPDWHLPDVPDMPEVKLEAPDFEEREVVKRMTSGAFTSAISTRFSALQSKFHSKFGKAFDDLDPRNSAATDVRFQIPSMDFGLFGGTAANGAGAPLLDVSVQEVFQDHKTLFDLLRITMLAILGFFAVYSSVKIVYGVL